MLSFQIQIVKKQQNNIDFFYRLCFLFIIPEHSPVGWGGSGGRTLKPRDNFVVGRFKKF